MAALAQAANADQASRDALAKLGSMASSMRDQSWNEDAEKAQGIDAFNLRQQSNTIGRNERNVNRTNTANQFNLSAEQNAADQNTGAYNMDASQVRGLKAGQAQALANLDIAKGNALANIDMGKANTTQNMFTGLGGAVSRGISAWNDEDTAATKYNNDQKRIARQDGNTEYWNQRNYAQKDRYIDALNNQES
jgi:hypothetical protein